MESLVECHIKTAKHHIKITGILIMIFTSHAVLLPLAFVSEFRNHNDSCKVWAVCLFFLPHPLRSEYFLMLPDFQVITGTSKTCAILYFWIHRPEMLTNRRSKDASYSKCIVRRCHHCAILSICYSLVHYFTSGTHKSILTSLWDVHN